MCVCVCVCVCVRCAVQVDLPIHVLEGDSALIRFEGSGFDSNALGMSAPFRMDPCLVPCTQRVPLPGQVRGCRRSGQCVCQMPKHLEVSGSVCQDLCWPVHSLS